jgi:hypothetical protein
LGYYSDGRIDSFSVLSPPNHPVIAIGLNERGGKRIADIGTEEGVVSGTRSTRVDGDPLELSQINIPDLNAIETWVNGKPEFRLRIVNSTGSKVFDSGEPANKFNPTRSLVNDPAIWYVMSFEVLNSWSFSNQGNTLGMHWVEVDGGTVSTTVEQTFTVKNDDGTTSSAKYIYTISNHDDDLGFVTINNSDIIWAEYQTASIRWYM